MSRLEAALRRPQELNAQSAPKESPAPAPVNGHKTERMSRALTALTDLPSQATGAPTPADLRGAGFYAEKLVITERPAQSTIEQYRKLAATLHHAQVEKELKVVMVSSAVSGDGKTLTSSNLALTLSESYRRRVLLIDADLRRPSLHSVFRVDGMTGLSEGLGAAVDQRFPVHQVSPFLTVLPAGRPSNDPMAGLTSDRMRRLIAEARTTFDWVIVDTPPVGLLPDGHLLTAMVDGAILVVKAGETPYPVVVRALESLGRDRILGVVLNQA